MTTGLYISWNGFELISAATRLQGIFFWDFFIYLIEGLVFLDHWFAGANAHSSNQAIIRYRSSSSPLPSSASW